MKNPYDNARWGFFLCWLRGYSDRITMREVWRCITNCFPSVRFWADPGYRRVHFWEHWDHVELRLFAYPTRDGDLDDLHGLSVRVEDHRWREPIVERQEL